VPTTQKLLAQNDFYDLVKNYQKHKKSLEQAQQQTNELQPPQDSSYFTCHITGLKSVTKSLVPRHLHYYVDEEIDKCDPRKIP
jgi:hypothetical protein